MVPVGDGTEDTQIKTEIYGFSGWIMSSVAYISYLLWAFLPDAVLDQFGITYYPSKYWAIALPAITCFFIGISGIFYVSISLLTTPSLDSYDTIQDEYSKDLRVGIQSTSHTSTTPEVSDMSISTVNKLLYN